MDDINLGNLATMKIAQVSTIIPWQPDIISVKKYSVRI